MSSSRHEQAHFGIDFGTTNSAVAMLVPGRGIELARFSFRGEEFPSCRSVLYFEQSKSANGQRRVHGYSGPPAIEHYLDADEKGRLMQSLKSYLSSHSLQCAKDWTLPGHDQKAQSGNHLIGRLRDSPRAVTIISLPSEPDCHSPHKPRAEPGSESNGATARSDPVLGRKQQGPGHLSVGASCVSNCN